MADYTTPVDVESPEHEPKRKKKPKLEIVVGATSVPVSKEMDKKAFAEGFAAAWTKHASNKQVTEERDKQKMHHPKKTAPELDKKMTDGKGVCPHTAFSEKQIGMADRPIAMHKKAFLEGFSDFCVANRVNPLALMKQANLMGGVAGGASGAGIEEKQAGLSNHIVNLLRMIGGGNAGRGAMLGGLGGTLLGGGAALGNWVNNQFSQAMGKK